MWVCWSADACKQWSTTCRGFKSSRASNKSAKLWSPENDPFAIDEIRLESRYLFAWTQSMINHVTRIETNNSVKLARPSKAPIDSDEIQLELRLLRDAVNLRRFDREKLWCANRLVMSGSPANVPGAIEVMMLLSKILLMIAMTLIKTFSDIRDTRPQ